MAAFEAKEAAEAAEVAKEAATAVVLPLPATREEITKDGRVGRRENAFLDTYFAFFGRFVRCVRGGRGLVVCGGGVWLWLWLWLFYHEKRCSRPFHSNFVLLTMSLLSAFTQGVIRRKKSRVLQQVFDVELTASSLLYPFRDLHRKKSWILQQAFDVELTAHASILYPFVDPAYHSSSALLPMESPPNQPTLVHHV